MVPEAWQRFGDRILTSDTFFEMETLPSSMAIIGLGVVGLELGQAMARLGVDVVGVARSRHLAGITDPAVREAAAATIGGEMTLWRGHTAELEEAGGKIVVAAGAKRKSVDAVLVATGRRSNLDGMGLEKLGTPLRDDGVPVYDAGTLQVGRLPIFIAGDANTARPILHEAWHDGLVAGHNALSERPARFKRRTPLHIVFSDPNIAMAGSRYGELEAGSFAVSEERFEDQARALIRHENVGLLRLYARPDSGRLLGAEMFAPAGEHLGHLLAWCIQQQLTVADILAMPFHHPVIEEGLRSALEGLAGMVQRPGATP
jgi:dihydrolipoamide dehydrogenase